MVMDSLDSLSPLEKFIESHGGTKVKMFEKIFGARKEMPMAGDARVPVLLQSIAAGADPKTQVDAIRSIVGDAKTDVQKEFHGFLDELAMCKDETPDTKSKAVEIVSSFYLEKVAGDSAMPDKDKGDKVEGKPKSGSQGKKKDSEDMGEEEEEEEEDDDEKKEEKSAGDSFDRFTALLEKIDARIATLEKSKEPPAVMENPAAVGSMRVLMGGDSASSKKPSTDDFIKSLL